MAITDASNALMALSYRYTAYIFPSNASDVSALSAPIQLSTAGLVKLHVPAYV